MTRTWFEKGTHWRESEYGWGGRQPVEGVCGHCHLVTDLSEVDAWFTHTPEGSSGAYTCECGSIVWLCWGDRAWLRRTKKAMEKSVRESTH